MSTWLKNILLGNLISLRPFPWARGMKNTRNQLAERNLSRNSVLAKSKGRSVCILKCTTVNYIKLSITIKVLLYWELSATYVAIQIWSCFSYLYWPAGHMIYFYIKFLVMWVIHFHYVFSELWPSTFHCINPLNCL